MSASRLADQNINLKFRHLNRNFKHRVGKVSVSPPVSSTHLLLDPMIIDEDEGGDKVGEGDDEDSGDDVDEVGEGNVGGKRPKPMVSGHQGGISPGLTLLVTLCLPYRYYTDMYFKNLQI